MAQLNKHQEWCTQIHRPEKIFWVGGQMCRLLDLRVGKSWFASIWESDRPSRGFAGDCDMFGFWGRGISSTNSHWPAFLRGGATGAWTLVWCILDNLPTLTAPRSATFCAVGVSLLRHVTPLPVSRILRPHFRPRVRGRGSGRSKSAHRSIFWPRPIELKLDGRVVHAHGSDVTNFRPRIAYGGGGTVVQMSVRKSAPKTSRGALVTKWRAKFSKGSWTLGIFFKIATLQFSMFCANYLVYQTGHGNFSDICGLTRLWSI